jgi:Tfp pilus assembly protein PilN
MADGDTPGWLDMKRWPQPDFLAGKPRPPLVAWLWAATGLTVLGLTLLDGLALQDELTEQDARLSQLSEQASRRAPRAPGPASASPTELDAARAATGLSQRLAYPWGEVLATLEAATPPGVKWLSLEHGLDQAELRLAGQAADIAAALRLVERMSAQPQWAGVVMTRLQLPEPSAGSDNGSTLRFELAARARTLAPQGAR